MLRRVAPCVAVLAIAGCGKPASPIPSRDGALAIDVRYPVDGTRVPAVDSIALWGTVGTGRATLTVNGASIQVEPNGTFAAFLPVPPGDDPALLLEARRGREREARRVPLERGPTAAPATTADGSGATPASPNSQQRRSPDDRPRPWSRWVVMRRLPSDTADSATQARPIYARWRPGGAVAIGIAQGIRLFSDARTADALRLRLASDAHVWIPIVDADTTARSRAPMLRASQLEVTRGDDELRLTIPLPERLPTTVELAGDRLYWTVYGAEWAPAPAASHGDRGAGTVRRVVPRDTASGRLVVDLGLVQLPLGWRTEWRDGALHLRVRLANRSSNSMAGLHVTLDPGHPPDGTIGPSGLMEDSVTLAVALAAAELLRRQGVTVTLTRATSAPVSLEARAAIAEQSAAHLFISIHVNAPGPGRPPQAVYGTQTYWMNPTGRALARVLLAEVARAMGHPAIGTYQGEYAVLRPTWPTAALVEGSGIVIPEREAYLRTTAGIEAYARGLVNGIERWQRLSASRALPVTRPREVPTRKVSTR